MHDSRRPIAIAAASLCALALLARSPALSAAPQAARSAAAAPRTEIQALYDQFNRLLKQGERYALKRHFLDHTTDDFVQKTDNGRKMNREDAAEAFDQGVFAVAQFTNAISRITSLTTKGSDVVVLYKDQTTLLVPDPQGKPHRVVVSSSNRDIWVKADGSWKTRLSETLSSSTLLDGKPLRASRSARRPRGGAQEPDGIGAWSLGR